MKLQGVIIDFDSWALHPTYLLEFKSDLDELDETPKGLRVVVSALREMVKSGLYVLWDSSHPAHIVGSSLFITNAPCDAYLTDGYGRSALLRLDRFRSELKLSNSTDWIYFSDSPHRLDDASNLGFKVGRLIELQSALTSVQEVITERGDVSESNLIQARERYHPRDYSKVIHPLLPSRALIIGDPGEQPRWKNVVAPLLRAIYPARVLPSRNTTTFSFVHYYDNPRLGQDLWHEIKDWHSGHSGETPNLLNLRFVAAVMSASMVEMGFDVIVPVPSVHKKQVAPAMASVRLSRLIGKVLSIPHREYLLKTGVGQFVASKFSQTSLLGFENICLVDDQLTTGRTMALCESAIKAEFEARSLTALAFSTTNKWS